MDRDATQVNPLKEKGLISLREAPVLKGIWLSSRPVRTSIERLLLEMLQPHQPHSVLRRSVIEELSRPAKVTDVALGYLGLQQVGVDSTGELPLVLVSPKPGRGDPWREALLDPRGDCPVGMVVTTRDRGRVALIHEVFARFPAPLKDLVRQYATLTANGKHHAQIVETLSSNPDRARHYAEMLADARRHVQMMLDPSVLFSPDGEVRVQLGSLSQTARHLLREGLRGEQVFILPQALFEAKTNYGDIEFLIYLNFFLRGGQRARIVGTPRQKRALNRLLTLVIFGIFDPEAPEHASLEPLHEAYGVSDPETYEFLRTCYETYAVRNGPDSSSAIARLEDYVDFIVLNSQETVIPVSRRDGSDGDAQPLGEVRVRPLASGSFDVRIIRADGQSTAKRMEVTTPRRMDILIPEELRRPLQFATDRPRFGVTPLGTSHGFDPVGDVTSFVIWINGRGLLVDPSPEAVRYLEQIGVAPVDVPYVLLTHVHADHDGGLLETLLSGSRTTVIASDVVFRAFVEKAQLITGYNFEREGLVQHVSANPGTPITIDIGGDRVTLESRWNLHPIPTNGFKVNVAGQSFGYSGDTQYDPDLIKHLRDQGRLSAAQYDDLLDFFWTPDGHPKVDLVYHEAGIPPIHTDKEKLQALSEAVTARMQLVHIADKDVPAGFVPSKPSLFATHVLRPTTAQSRDEILMDTMRMVSYLYDIPSDTLENLLRGAEICRYPKNTLILRKGPVGKNEPLQFFIIADGEVLVRDDRRLVTKLRKADTFGEWGISHQRGFRVADVVTTRPCQCIQLTEEQYWWLVERHPVIQDRIGKIRSLLPRLELAQARQQLRTGANTSETLSVITHMTIGQLSGLAIFSHVRTYKKGQHIIVQGEQTDGFYILLSGHLIATVRSLTVGDLSEGDIFGEMGLLEGVTRRATITVASADAEVLFVSTQNFLALLERMPAFSWGVREIAARRRDPARAVSA